MPFSLVGEKRRMTFWVRKIKSLGHWHTHFSIASSSRADSTGNEHDTKCTGPLRALNFVELE